MRHKPSKTNLVVIYKAKHLPSKAYIVTDLLPFIKYMYHQAVKPAR